MDQQKIIIDTDGGIDGALGVLLALASPELQLRAVTILSGSVPAEEGITNAISLLEMVGDSGIPVERGMEVALVTPRQSVLGSLLTAAAPAPTLPPQPLPSPRPAIDRLIEQILSTPGQVTLITLGPLTNLAMAIRLEPSIIHAVREVIILGGAIRHSGNATPLAEFNMYQDPHAAHIVFHSGLPITLVPLDVTHKAILARQDLNRLMAFPSPLAFFIGESLQAHMEFLDDDQTLEGCLISAPLAVALAATNDLAEMEALYVDIDLSSGVCQGKTFADYDYMQKKMPNMQVAMGLNVRPFVEWFLERMEQLCRTAQ